MSDVLDDVYLISTERGWRGTDNRRHPTEIEKGYAADIVNGRVDTIGLIKSRKGLSLVGDDGGSSRVVGLADFNPEGGTRVLLRVFGTTVQLWTGSGNWSNISGFSLTSDLITNIIVAQSRAFFFNGTNNCQSSDGSSVTDEGNTNTDPPRGTVAEWIINRLFVAGVTGDESSVYFSDSLAPQTFNRTSNFKRINMGDNYKIKGLKKFREFELLIFKEIGIYILDLADALPENWIPSPVDIRFGTKAGRTIIQVGSDIWFLSNDGHIRSITRNEQNKLTGADVPVSYEIQDWIDDINMQYIHLSSAVYFQNKAYFFVPTGTATRPDKCLVYDFISKGWTRDDARNILSAVVSDIEGDGEVLYGGESQADSKVYRVDDPAEEDDNTAAIALSVQTRRDDMEAPLVDKIFNFAEFEFEATGGAATVSAQVDANGYTELGDIDLTGGGVALPADLPMIFPNQNLVREKFDLEKLGRGRDIQYKVEFSSATEEMRLSGIMTAAVAQNIERE